MSKKQEIEIRFRVADLPAMVQKMAGLGVPLQRVERIVDEWFAPSTHRTLQDEEAWFEKENGVAWRLRTTEVEGKKHTIRDSKQLPKGDVTHTTFDETPPVPVEHAAATAELRAKGLHNWLKIDKTRHIFDTSAAPPELAGVLVSIDEVKGLAEKIGVGACLELEYDGPEVDGGKALTHLSEAAALLGLSPEDRFEKSLTVLAKPALANFAS